MSIADTGSGMAPDVRDHLLDLAQNSLLREHFDFEFYFEVTGQTSLDGPVRERAPGCAPNRAPRSRPFVDRDYDFSSRLGSAARRK